MRIQNKTDAPWKRKGRKISSKISPYKSFYTKKKIGDSKKSSVQVQKIYGWESKGSVEDKTDTYETKAEQGVIKINNQGKQFQNTAATTTIADRLSYSNPYIAVVIKAKETFKKAKERLSEAYNEGKKKEENNTKPIVRAIAIVAVGIFSFYMLIILTILPVIIGASVASSGMEYFSSDETSIVNVAAFEYYAAEENIGGYKYKYWYGINGDWCAMFVSWCANQCGYIDYGLMPKTASVANMATWYQSNDLWKSKESGYIPEPGDIVFFQENMSHVGLVIGYDAERNLVVTIEGNTGQSDTEIYHEGSHVAMKNYPITYARITGYGTPDYPKIPFGKLAN